MNISRKYLFAALFLMGALSIVSFAQRQPSEPLRPFVVMKKQSLADLEKKISTENKVEELVGGNGMQTRVAIQHDKIKENSDAELHDASDDVYYVLEGEAELTLGGRLELPREISPGEWRSKTIAGGQKMIIKKGDLIVVPRGTPHQRNTTKKKNFSLILIKVYKDPLPQPK